MNVFWIGLGAGIIAFILMQVYGGEKFKGGSNGFVSFIFGLGVSILIWGLLS